MGKAIRKIKIDLSKFDPSWKDSYILVSTSGFRDQKDYAVKMAKIERESKKATRLHTKIERKLNNLIEKGVDEGEDYEMIEKEEEKLYKLSEEASVKLLDTMQKDIVSRFVSGQVFDSESTKLRPMTKEDVIDFDFEVLGEISRAIAGQNSKNA